jgi:hypothetical protein
LYYPIPAHAKRRGGTGVGKGGRGGGGFSYTNNITYLISDTINFIEIRNHYFVHKSPAIAL